MLGRSRTTCAAALLLLCTSPLAGQQGTCGDAVIANALERSRKLPAPPTLLFDGKASLPRAPSRPIAIPPDVIGAMPACVLLSATFVEEGGALYVAESGSVAATGQGMGLRGRGAALYQAGTGILREMAQQQLLPATPRPGVRYLVAIPIARDHPLYASSAPAIARGDAPAAAAPASAPSLAQRGYRDARFLREADGVQVFLLGERGNEYWFALVRRLQPGEPVLDFRRDPTVPDVLGSEATQRFQRLVLPHVRETGAQVAGVEVRHYAAGTSIRYQPGSPYPHNESGAHPLQGTKAEVPVGIERWRGERRGSTGSFTWSSAGTYYTDLNSVAAIQAVQDSVGMRLEARAAARADRDAREVAEVRAARARMEERERRKPALYKAAGLTYRPADYWATFAMGPTLRNIHDGYYPDARADWVFGRTYFRAVTTYGDKCRALLPPGSAMRIDSRFTHDDLLGWVPGKVDTIYIHPDFAPVFRGWHEQRPGMPVTTPGDATPTGMISNPGAGTSAAFEVARVKDALRADMPKLFAEGCKSGTVVQFMENLRRLGNGEPTLQAQRVQETLPRPDDAPTTIGEACMRYGRDNGHPPNTRWCSCIDRELTPRYKPDDLFRLLENYSAFIERVSYPPPGGGNQVPLREYLAANPCRDG